VFSPQQHFDISTTGRFTRNACPDSEEYFKESVGMKETSRCDKLATLVYMKEKDRENIAPVGIFKHINEHLLLSTVSSKGRFGGYSALRGGIYQIQTWLDKQDIDDTYSVSIVDELCLSPARLSYGYGIHTEEKIENRHNLLQCVDEVLETYLPKARTYK